MEYGNFNLEYPKPVLYDEEDQIVFFYKNSFVLLSLNFKEYFIANVDYSIFSLVERAGFMFFDENSLIEKKEIIERAKDTLLKDEKGTLQKGLKRNEEILENSDSQKKMNIQSINECKKANLI